MGAITCSKGWIEPRQRVSEEIIKTKEGNLHFENSSVKVENGPSNAWEHL